MGSKNTKRKHKRRGNRSQTLLAKRRSQVLSLLDVIGLGEGFRQLPARTRDFIVSHRAPVPRLILAPEVERLPNVEALRNDLNSIWTSIQVTLKSTDYSTTLLQFMTGIRALGPYFEHCGHYPGLKAPHRQFCLKAGRVLNALYQSSKEDAMLQLESHLGYYMALYSRIDKHVLRLSVEQPMRSDGRPEFVVRVKLALPETDYVSIHGTSRQVYRCGGDWGDNDTHWIEALPPGADGDVDRKPLPAFVQPHMIRKLKERLDIPQIAGIFHDCVYQAFAEPVWHPGTNGNHLLEVQLCGRKLGYLVVTCAENKLIARTFLFLTMDGTPEGDRFRQLARLSRQEAQYLQLDRLSTFQGGDLGDDPVLRPFLEKLGLHHLCDMLRDPNSREGLVKGIARDVRRYLGDHNIARIMREMDEASQRGSAHRYRHGPNREQRK